MKKFSLYCLLLILAICLILPAKSNIKEITEVHAKDVSEKYYTVYDADNPTKVVFVKGESIDNGDEYISGDNKLYEVVEVNKDDFTGRAKYKEDVKLPVVNVRRSAGTKQVASAANKKVGIYHTHNDECYITPDGTDSIYGKGGIHDVGKRLKSQFEKIGIEVAYSENLHLPHNSGAYTRSQTTAATLLKDNNLSGLFDIHRDSTPKKEYETKVNGESMSKIRMVVGAANQNSAENKKFAKTIKAYADEVYPGLIKDIYIGKGNYNQQLTPRAMLFEFGCEKIEKEKALKSTVPLSKTLDMVLFGSDSASAATLQDVDLTNLAGESVSVSALEAKGDPSISFVYILLGGIGFYALVLGIVCIFSKTARYKTGRFFSELFAGLFGRKKRKIQ